MRGAGGSKQNEGGVLRAFGGICEACRGTVVDDNLQRNRFDLFSYCFASFGDTAFAACAQNVHLVVAVVLGKPLWCPLAHCRPGVNGVGHHARPWVVQQEVICGANHCAQQRCGTRVCAMGWRMSEVPPTWELMALESLEHDAGGEGSARVGAVAEHEALERGELRSGERLHNSA